MLIGRDAVAPGWHRPQHYYPKKCSYAATPKRRRPSKARRRRSVSGWWTGPITVSVRRDTMSKNRCRKLRVYNGLTGSYSESEGPLWELATLSPLAWVVALPEKFRASTPCWTRGQKPSSKQLSNPRRSNGKFLKNRARQNQMLFRRLASRLVCRISKNWRPEPLEVLKKFFCSWIIDIHIRAED